MWQIQPDNGPYKVMIKRGEWLDERRLNDDGSVRSVPFKLYYPSDFDGGAAPVIFWSHGYGGSRDGAGFLARYLASFGYILVHLTHYGTDSSLWEGKPGHPWDILRDITISRQTTLNRYKDVPFAIDALAKWVAGETDLERLLDLSHLGMSGHSFGAITTQTASGQLTPDEAGDLISLHEPRITSGIAYSPVPGTSHLSDDMHEAGDIYSAIKTPLLHMTGTEDKSPLKSDSTYQDRLKIFEQTGQAPKAILVKQGGDHMVYNGTRGQLDANPNRDRHEEIVKVVSKAWWDAYLKDDAAAQDWLQNNGAMDYLAQDATWNYKNI